MSRSNLILSEDCHNYWIQTLNVQIVEVVSELVVKTLLKNTVQNVAIVSQNQMMIFLLGSDLKKIIMDLAQELGKERTGRR